MLSSRKIFSAGMAIIIAFVTLAGVSKPAKAAAYSYTSPFSLQNLSSSTANVTITFYDQNGSIPASSTINATIAGNSIGVYALTTISSGFNGSVVASSDQPLASTVNVNATASGKSMWAAYSGGSTGSTTVYLPLLDKGNFGINSWFNVQNAGTSTANVTVNYSDGSVYTNTIAPGAAKTFDQANETHSLTVFSAIVTSNQPVIAVVMREDAATVGAYTGFAGGSTNPVFPLVNAQPAYGIFTGISIQNLTGTSTNVTVTFIKDDASTCTETQTIAGNSQVNFGLYAFTFTPTAQYITDRGYSTTCTGAKPRTWVGAGRVSSNSASVAVVAAVVQAHLGYPSGNYTGAYSAFNPSVATSKVVYPLIMDRNYGYFTGIGVMNVGSSTTSVTCTFSGTGYSVTKSLAPNEVLVDVQQNKIAANYVGGGTCIATGGDAKIVGEVNQFRNGYPYDELLVSEGTNN
jgi:hypothetical protein